MGYQWITEWAGYNLSYGTGSADAFHNDPNRSFNYVGNTPLTGYVTIGESKTWTVSEGNAIQFIFSSASSWSSVAHYNGSNIASIAFSGSGYNRTDLLMMVDETNEKCALYEICYRANDGLSFIFSITNNSNEHNAYLLYLAGNIPPIVYNWQSVPSISGKNGILSLAQIKEEYINEGESVSGASADHFTNLSTENRVDVLIDAALPAPEIGGTTVTVKYTIPSLSSGSYEYCKLVAKKNSMPEGPEDGDKIIDIDPTAVSVSVKNLKGHTKYYFAIFIKDADGNESSSNIKSITTQGAVIPEEYQQYLDLLALTAWGMDSGQTLLAYANRRGNSSTSIVSSDHSFVTSGNFNANQFNYGFSVLELSTINISTDPVTVLYTCNVAEYDIIKTSGRDMWGVYSENGNGADYIQPWGSITGVSSPGNTDGLRFGPTTSFSSLGDCLVYLTQHFRHVNVKVDGEYWLKLD